MQWRGQSSSFHPVKRSLRTTELSAVIDALMIGPEHIVRVIAVNANGQGVASPEVSGTYHFEAPGPPTITALHRLDERIELHWEPPEDDGGDRVTGYQIQHKRADETEWQVSFGDLLDTGWIAAYHHTWQMPGFEMGILYDFQMRARNDAGTSPWTRAHQVRAGRWGMPGTPVLIAISPGDGFLTVRWDSPSNTGIGKVRYYNVQWKLASDRNWNPGREHQLDDPDARRYTISGLDNGLPYHVRLRVGAFGTSGWAYGSGTPSATHAVPDAPVITGVSSADETLSVTWRAPLNNGGQEINSYELEYEESSGTDWKQATRSDGDMSTAQQITGLQNGKLYQVRIRAVNPTGNGDWATSSGIPEVPPGAVTIRGIAEVGETLVADTSHIIDEDGPVSVAYGYQWLSGANTEIVGAISSTYTVRSSDVGKTIKVRVSFTNEAGREETLTSAATDTVRRGGVVVWEGELMAGQQTDLSPVESGYSTYGDLGGSLSPDRFLLEGTTYRVKFLAHSRESLWLGLDRELPADFTLLVADSHYRGSESMVPPSIDGVAAYWWPSTPPDWLGDDPVRVGLTVHPEVPLGDRQKAPVTGYFHSFPPEHDGIEDVSFRIFFSEVVSTTASALRDQVLSVSGGTVSSVQAVGDEGMVWAVLVTPESSEPIAVRIEADLDCALPGAICTPDGRRLFNRLELTVEAKEWNPPTGAPTIRGGTVEAGQTLTVDTSGIADADGLTGAAFRYQWELYDGNAYTDIQGATDSTYTLVPADEGKAFRVRVSFADDAGYEESLTSGLYGSERPYGLSASASDGVVVLNWKLPAGWPYSSMFQILRNRPELGETGPLVHVRFAETTGTSYTDTDVEPGVLYVYRVKGVDPFGYTGEASQPYEIRTAETSPVENNPATGAPTISGTAQVGEALSADTSGISDEDGLDNASFSYQWLSNDGDNNAELAGGTGNTYTLVAGYLGKTIQVRVSFTDDRGNEESLTSEATEAVAAAPNPLTASIHDPPNNHDGRNPFTFELRFSEEPDPDFSYKTLRDHAFTVTRGTVTKARRLAPPGNVHWEITVLPNSNDDVSVVLSVTRDCGDQGAVCTGDGRMLSAEVELTAAGPAGEEGQTPRGNNPATGAPTIRGMARVGATLRVSLLSMAEACWATGAVDVQRKRPR